MIYTTEVQHMCPVAKGAYHGPAPIPEEGKWVQAKEISDISGFTHGVGWCAPQQGACKLTLNIKNGIIEEALVETIGCSGMTHSAAMASEILIGKTILEALNTDLVCDAINTAMRELFLQIVYGRSQSAFSEGGLSVGASLEDLGKGLRSQVGTMFATKAKGPRYLEMAEGYVTRVALNKDNEIIGYEFINLGKMMDAIKTFNDIINNMPESEAAFKLAKEGLIARLRTERIIKSDIIWSYINAQDLGQNVDSRIKLYNDAQNMTLKDVTDFQKKWIKGRTYTYCILGDKKELDMEKLKEVGPIRELTQEEIFGY